jgi:hypothetical protein
LKKNIFFFQTQAAPAPTPKRKKSLPDAAAAAAAAANVMSREEASVLSSARREEIRRQIEEAERYRANPLLYFVSPQVKVPYAIPGISPSFLFYFQFQRILTQLQSGELR